MGKSLGMIETIGLAGCIAATDAMLKASNIKLAGTYNRIGSGLISIMVQGEIGAVRAAVEAGEQAAERLTEIKSVHIIPRPHQEVEKL
ncbi:MAG TPA: BMC domain-containing protein, partial [Halanaerobiales bacterium]|nr:BMC domain-containing protein [Halanaerobiales bacterium]